MLFDLHEPVVALMRQVARDVVMPRFRNLAADEIAEKAADDFVTIEFAGVKSTEIDTESRIAFRKLLHALGEQDVGFGIVELDETPAEMARLRDNASFAATMGLTGMSR